MAGRPLRKQRLSQAPVARAGLSINQWRALSEAEKLEVLFGCSLDRAFEVLSWPADGLDPVRLSAQTAWGRAVMMLAGKFGIEAARERQQTAALEELARRLRARKHAEKSERA